ncbi:AraC family transcriptional regulator [Paenibacillus thiaminolyticus]|uniref:AraC family transcriptional regulator n=1 Tax=Paenibacillus thiaminolyticus TaxID=49283 RepID=UPI003D2C3D6E
MDRNVYTEPREKPKATMPDPVCWPTPMPYLVSTTEGVSPSFQRLHWHRELEINYIRGGTGFCVINGIKYQLQAGDIILINGQDLHRAFETDHLVIDVHMFDPGMLAMEMRYDYDLLRPFREQGIQFTNLVNRDMPAYDELIAILLNMKEEMEVRAPSYASVIRAQLTRFLALVNRHGALAEGEAAPVKHRGIHALKELILTMELNLAYPWTLKELAELTHLSPSRFSALFQQAVGTSPLDYLIQLRLTQAVHLLESSDEKIIDIASECGFRNLSNFNRLFRQLFGVSPSEIRNQRTKKKQ